MKAYLVRDKWKTASLVVIARSYGQAKYRVWLYAADCDYRYTEFRARRIPELDWLASDKDEAHILSCSNYAKAFLAAPESGRCEGCDYAATRGRCPWRRYDELNLAPDATIKRLGAER